MSERKIKFGTMDVSVDGDKLKIGDTAPNFTATSLDLSDYDFYENKNNKITIISVLPSIDTSVCEIQTLKFSKAANDFNEDINVLTISNDLPFAQNRFLEVKDIDNITFVSDYIYHDFAKKYSVFLKEVSLLNRSVFVVDRDNKLRYVEYLDQNTDLPEYEKAIEIAKSL